MGQHAFQFTAEFCVPRQGNAEGISYTLDITKALK